MLVSPTQRIMIAEADLTTQAAAFAANDLVATKIELTNVGKEVEQRGGGSWGGGIIQHVTLIDLAAQLADTDIVFFDRDPENTTFTLNSALTLADADAPGLIGVAKLTSHTAFAASGFSQALNLAIPFLLSGSRSLFAAAITRGTPTYAATTDLKLRVALLLD